MDVGVKAPQRQATVAQLLCLVLLTLIFLGIAATIVLSLISVYVPTRDSPPAARVTSGPQQASIPLSSNAGLTSGSSLDATNLNSLQSQMQNAMASDSSVSHSATVNVQSATVGGSSKRKRRQATSSSVVLIVIYELVYSHVCVSRRCRLFTLGRSQTLFPSLSISLPSITNGNTVTSDIETISEYWANYRPYKDNPANYFGVTDTGLPAGCQVEQVHVMHRHATRYPTHNDLVGIEGLQTKIKPFLGSFTGPLSFLNTWSLRLGNDTLVPQGRAEEYTSGTQFWGKYARLLYEAPAGQATYNDTNQDKPFLRCNTVQRIVDSASMWAEGFFGPYNATTKYTLTRMDVTSRNNTLASYNGCPNFAPNGQHPNFFNFSSNYYGTFPLFLTDAVTRLSAYGPSGVNFNVNDTYQMQNLCVFEYGALGSSDFCSLFTLNEWKGFDYIWDLALYNGYSFGNPAGRALGLGYLQELIARLKGELITVSESTVNTNLTSNAATFPLNRPFYLDMTHDFTIVNLIAAASIDYFRKKLTFTSFPPPTRTFRVARITPYAARFITEKIGCVSQNPTATSANATQYSTTQYQYSKSAATYKFIRMRLNSAIVPISTIRGGFCAGRTDGMCPLSNFLASQANASAAANFQSVCYSKFTYDASKFGEDGNYFP